jgi:hypothetical protein
MRYVGAFSLVAASLIGSASLPEHANAQSNPYALDRLFLMPSDKQPLYQVLSFTNETEVENYYGVGSNQAHLATDFFTGLPKGDTATMLFTRYPELSARAHLYGGNISNLASLQAITNGTLTITSQGYNISGSVNLSGVTSFSAAATRITNALNAHLPTVAATTGSSITPVSVSFTGSVNGLLLDVTSLTRGSMQIGAVVSGPGIPGGAQITGQVTGTPGGVGVYGLFVPEGSVPSEALTETYGVLTVGSVSSGTVAAGQQVTGPGILPLTAIEKNLSGSGAGSTWVVNNYQTVKSQAMTMTPAPLQVVYQHVTGQTENTNRFLVQQDVEFNFASSKMSYMSGTAAAALGLAQNSPSGCSGLGCAYDSSPGEIVMSASQWMENFIQMNPNDHFFSFQSAWDPKSAIPPGEQSALEAWAQSTGGEYDYLINWSANTPPIKDMLPGSAALPFAATGAMVPEPSTWAMVLLGFAGLGLARYRPRRSTCLSGPRIGSTGRAAGDDRLVR